MQVAKGVDLHKNSYVIGSKIIGKKRAEIVFVILTKLGNTLDCEQCIMFFCVYIYIYIYIYIHTYTQTHTQTKSHI